MTAKLLVVLLKCRFTPVLQLKKYAEKGLNKAKLDYLLERINRLEQTLAPRHGVLENRSGAKQNSESSTMPRAASAGLKGSMPAM